MENLLIAENIRSFFPEAGPFSLTIHAGDRCHVQGSSRSCNALFEIFTGLRKPDEGSVTVRGKMYMKCQKRNVRHFAGTILELFQRAAASCRN